MPNGVWRQCGDARCESRPASSSALCSLASGLRLPSRIRFGPARYVAYALKRDGEPVWTELGDAEPIDRAIASLRATLEDPTRSDTMRQTADLRSLITEPVERLASGATQLILSPDGDLNLLPFQVLTEENGAFLLRKYLIS